MYECQNVCNACRGQKGAPASLELWLQVVVSCPMLMLGIEPESFRGVMPLTTEPSYSPCESDLQAEICRIQKIPAL